MGYLYKDVSFKIRYIIDQIQWCNCFSRFRTRNNGNYIRVIRNVWVFGFVYYAVLSCNFSKFTWKFTFFNKYTIDFWKTHDVIISWYIPNDFFFYNFIRVYSIRVDNNIDNQNTICINSFGHEENGVHVVCFTDRMYSFKYFRFGRLWKWPLCLHQIFHGMLHSIENSMVKNTFGTCNSTAYFSDERHCHIHFKNSAKNRFS